MTLTMHFLPLAQVKPSIETETPIAVLKVLTGRIMIRKTDA